MSCRSSSDYPGLVEVQAWKRVLKRVLTVKRKVIQEYPVFKVLRKK